MDPKSGQILALATWPHYDPLQYSNFNLEDFKNPALTNLYEPGSTFKTITVSAGIDSGAITPETICTKCNGPRKISGYTIKTWNEEYHPNIDMKEALRKSDNIAMIFAAEKIGADRFLDYLHKFGFGEPLDIDLQEDTKTPLPDHLGPVELATVSFGQGISANSLQIVRAVAAIANQGVMMKPYLVKKVHDPLTNETIQYEPQIMRRVISAKTAAQVTEMMVYAAPDRPNWIDQNYTVAGKTGTAQIASQTGGYREEGTIASYIGFAPAENPKFVMLVKLVEPKLSQWGATTAVPIWYEVADKIILRL
jgi:cell division protein FtsI/penicillin-binding protein 2